MRRSVLVLTALALLWGVPARAQAALTLDEAIAQARAFSPLLRASRIGLDQADAARRGAEADRWPAINLSSSLSRAGQGSGIMTGGNAWNTKLALTQPVFDAWRVDDALDQAAIAREKASFELASADLDLQYEVARAFFDVLRTRALEQAATFDTTQAQAQVDLARTRMRLKVGTQLDVLQAQSVLASARDRHLQSQTAVTTALLRLETDLGAPVQLPLAEPATLAVVPEGHPASPSVALAGRPDLQALEAARRAQEVTARQRSRGMTPSFDAGGNVEQTLAGATNLTVIGTLTWKLLDSGRQSAQVDQARLEADRAAAILQARQQAALLDLASAREALRSSEARIRLTQGQLATAQEALHLAKLRFEGGVGTSLEVIQALTAFNQAQTAAIAARFDRAAAVLKLGQVKAVPVAALLDSGRLAPMER